MKEILIDSLLTYGLSAVIISYVVGSILFNLLKRIKNIEKKGLRSAIRILLVFVLGVGLISYFAYFVIPIAVANVEYSENNTKEITGQISDVTTDKDHVYIEINETKYILLKGYIIDYGILKRSDKISIKVGKYSRYVFEIE